MATPLSSRTVCSSLLLLTALAGACASRANPGALDDAQLAVRVKTALVNDAIVGERPIEVRVTNGMVTLRGTVTTDEERQRAVTVARGVTGVRDVRTELALAAVRPPSIPSREPTEDEPRHDLIAVGLSVGWSEPRDAALGGGFRIGPLVRLGRSRGWGTSFGFSWYSTELAGNDGGRAGELRVRPLMGGVGYTFVRGGTATTLSMVAGPAFNSYSPADDVDDAPVVDIDNSLAWRPGVSVWHDVGSRWTINAFAGYVIARPGISRLERGQLVDGSLRADTIILQTGLAYRLF